MQRHGGEDAPRQLRPPPPQPGHLPRWGGAAPGAAHGERRQNLCGPALRGSPRPAAARRAPAQALGRVSRATRHPHPALPPLGDPPIPPCIPAGGPGWGWSRFGGRAPRSAAPPAHPRAPPALPCPALPAPTPKRGLKGHPAGQCPAQPGWKCSEPQRPLHELCPFSVPKGISDLQRSVQLRPRLGAAGKTKRKEVTSRELFVLVWLLFLLQRGGGIAATTWEIPSLMSCSAFPSCSSG